MVRLWFILQQTVVVATPLTSSHDVGGCGSQSEPVEVAEAAFEMYQHISSLDLPQSIVVDTYIHVVAASNATEDGYISVELPPLGNKEHKMKVFNDDFTETGFSFVVKNIDWTINPKWARHDTEMAINREMAKKLRKGTYSALNLYYILSSTRFGGVCAFPVSPVPNDYSYDGCVQVYGTTPNVNDRFIGRVTSHEVGHWFIRTTRSRETAATARATTWTIRPNRTVRMMYTSVPLMNRILVLSLQDTAVYTRLD
ncbi:hypothetical protein VHEMI05896 [[Torrubiella] hemipterigena]|uniref:Peptidase M43 pregnancy-associated plasma-A domain-containing protein n=1 Tax=[Torrubiella] hemipterigena TaxID=1531966 RepID=A0A0A1THS6_9HYPO|nr:hypothetical protein VHEMI05896 [[Torrubiella] hemipterigena]